MVRLLNMERQFFFLWQRKLWLSLLLYVLQGAPNSSISVITSILGWKVEIFPFDISINKCRAITCQFFFVKETCFPFVLCIIEALIIKDKNDRNGTQSYVVIKKMKQTTYVGTQKWIWCYMVIWSMGTMKRRYIVPWCWQIVYLILVKELEVRCGFSVQPVFILAYIAQ